MSGRNQTCTWMRISEVLVRSPDWGIPILYALGGAWELAFPANPLVMLMLLACDHNLRTTSLRSPLYWLFMGDGMGIWFKCSPKTWKDVYWKRWDREWPGPPPAPSLFPQRHSFLDAAAWKQWRPSCDHLWPWGTRASIRMPRLWRSH